MVASAAGTLGAAIGVVAPAGDEGRALAFLSLEQAVLAEGTPARKDADDHLSALLVWMRDTRKGSSLEVLGAQERVLVQRSLLEPTPEVMAAARDAVLRWIDESVRLKEEKRSATSRPRREDAIEAFRAWRSGAETLAALHLRHGDAAGALADIDSTAARRIVPPGLYDRLERAASGGDAVSWRELLAWLWSPERRESAGRLAGHADDPELAIDPGLLRAALWGTTVEAYRLDPMLPDVSIALATLLVQFGLSEVAPLVLADAVVAHPDPVVLSGALNIVLQTIAREDDAEDTASARRVYAAAQPLLSLAARPELASRVEPSASRVQAAMGTVETRAGNLAAAAPLLESAISVEPSVEALMTLANIDRQAGRIDRALERLTKALAAPEVKQNPIVAGEAHLARFEILRQAKAEDKARAELAQALGAALEARQRATTNARKAHAERLLARVLDRYADRSGAARAMERAFAAADQDRRELAATVLESAQRALLRRDPVSARSAVRRGLGAELRDDDLVYAALWLLLAEKDTRMPPDGTAARALSGIHDDGRWPSRLAAWGLGRIKDAELVGSARTIGQKTEAAFYTGLARRIAGDTAAGDSLLDQVAKSSAIDLIEVQLARDLLAGPTGGPGALPAGISVP